MTGQTPIGLPWNYWVYQILAVLGVITPLTWHTVLWPELFLDPRQTLVMLSFPLITGGVVIYTTIRLKQGGIPSIIKIGWTDRRAPGNLHRFLLGNILMGSSMSFLFGPYHFGLDSAYIVLIVCMISGMYLFFSGMATAPSPSLSK